MFSLVSRKFHAMRNIMLYSVSARLICACRASFRLLLSLIYLIQKQILDIAIKTLRFIKCGFELWMREMNNLGYFMVLNGTKYVLCTKFLIQNVTKISF